jgi:uncharacterized membrane-anchored protein
VRRGLFIAAVVVQALVLVAWSAGLEWELAGAERIRLEVVQRDPRDLLRGDYVWLQYVIADIPLETIAGGRPDYGDRVWVTLTPQDNVYALAAASRAPVSPGPGQRVIVGRVQSLANSSGRGPEVHIVYGIERLYVPEGRGVLPRGKVEAEIALAQGGRPFLTRIFVEGRPYPSEAR